tara:strand:- start:152 stop:463 length:312 start_codon:yes stop_codon:yes gene_type:complete
MARFTSETARIAGQKSKRGGAKRDPIVHDAMEILLTEGMAKLYEKMDELNTGQLLKLVQISANYVLPKAKPQNDRFTQEFKDNRIEDWSKKKTDFMDEERNRK